MIGNLVLLPFGIYHTFKHRVWYSLFFIAVIVSGTYSALRSINIRDHPAVYFNFILCGAVLLIYGYHGLVYRMECNLDCLPWAPPRGESNAECPFTHTPATVRCPNCWTRVAREAFHERDPLLDVRTKTARTILNLPRHAAAVDALDRDDDNRKERELFATNTDGKNSRVAPFTEEQSAAGSVYAVDGNETKKKKRRYNLGPVTSGLGPSIDARLLTDVERKCVAYEIDEAFHFDANWLLGAIAHCCIGCHTYYSLWDVGVRQMINCVCFSALFTMLQHAMQDKYASVAVRVVVDVLAIFYAVAAAMHVINTVGGTHLFMMRYTHFDYPYPIFRKPTGWRLKLCKIVSSRPWNPYDGIPSFLRESPSHHGRFAKTWRKLQKLIFLLAVDYRGRHVMPDTELLY